jgi:hypothetical protein
VLKINSFYTIILLAFLLASLIGGIWVVYNLDPQAGLGNVALFFAASAVFVISAVALVLYYFRQRFGTRELVHRHFLVSVRQGFLVGLCYATALYLQSKGLFSWVNAGLLAAALVFLESYFIYSERRRRTAQADDIEAN